MKQTKTLLELADDYAKAYFMGRGEDARKLLQAAIILTEVEFQSEINRLKEMLTDHAQNNLEKAEREIERLEAHTKRLESLLQLNLQLTK